MALSSFSGCVPQRLRVEILMLYWDIGICSGYICEYGYAHPHVVPPLTTDIIAVWEVVA